MAELELARAALKATQRLATSMQNRYFRLGAERFHRAWEKNRRDRVASAFAGWVNMGSKPEVPQGGSSTAASPPRPEVGPVRPPVNGVVLNGPGPTVVSGAREVAPSPRQATEERENAPSSPVKLMQPFTFQGDEGASYDRRAAVEETRASRGGEASVSPTACDKHTGLRQHPSPRSGQGANASVPVAAPRGATEDRDKGRVVGSGFPFPARVSTPVSTTAPSCAASRPAEVAGTSNANAKAGASAGVSTPVPCPGGSGRSALPDPPRVMIALRAAVGHELYSTGESLLRRLEADHRELHGKSYRPVPITGAERDQFHACLQDATRGPLRRAVLNLLRVQESYRAIAVERDRAGVERRGEGWRDGGDGDRRRASGGGGARGESGGSRRAGFERELSSLATGPMSSPAEKARAARYYKLRVLTFVTLGFPPTIPLVARACGYTSQLVFCGRLFVVA